MPSRLFRLYQRKRIININVNIAAAGLLAIAIGAGIVWVFKRAFPGLPRRRVLAGLAITLTSTLVPLRWLARGRNGWLLKRADLL